MKTDFSVNHDIDYSQLHIETEFKKYQALINELAPTDAHDAPLYDFDLFEARPVFSTSKEGTFGAAHELIGIEKRSPDPIKTARIQVRNARGHNAQIENAQARAGQGTFYLIRKA